LLGRAPVAMGTRFARRCGVSTGPRGEMRVCLMLMRGYARRRDQR
jgi:hypothetical protein